MSLMETLKKKGDDIIDEGGEEYLGKLIDEGRKAADVLKGLGLGEEGTRAAYNALNLLDANKKPFVRLGKVGFAHLMGHWEDGDEAAARRLYLETQATFAERRAAMHAAGDAAVAESKEREESWNAVLGVLKGVGEIGLKFLVRMVLSGL